jgi:ubiquinone biosynthesis protein Coq4
MSGNWRARVLYGLHTGLVFAINPSDTLQVNLMTVGIDYRGLRALGARFAADPRWHRLVTERATIDTKHVDFEYLRKLGPETLGGAYVRMLDRNGLDPDFFQPPPEWPEDQAYVLQRLRQTHDMMHVLTGLDTDIPGEIALQAFVRVQLRLLFSLFVVVFGGMIYAPRYPRMVPLIVRAYIAGHRADLLFSTRWEDLWEVPLEEVRRRFHITNLECPRPSDVSESATRPADATAALRIPAAQAACWAAE